MRYKLATITLKCDYCKFNSCIIEMQIVKRNEFVLLFETEIEKVYPIGVANLAQFEKAEKSAYITTTTLTTVCLNYLFQLFCTLSAICLKNIVDNKVLGI